MKILGLDISGQPKAWLTNEQAAFYYAKDLVGWEMGTDITLLSGGIQAATGLQSTLNLNSIIAIKGKANAKAYLAPRLSNKALFARDAHICAYCGVYHPSTELTRDHVIPTSKKGKNIWSNVVAACKPCNRRKDDNLLEDITMKLIYVPYTPNKYEHLILMNRKILADQREFLIKGVGKRSRLI